MTETFGMRLTPAERNALTLLGEEMGVNDADVVRAALHNNARFAKALRRATLALKGAPKRG